MNTKFKIDGCYDLEITSDGYLYGANGQSGACSKGNVGIQVNYTPIALTAEESQTRTVASVFLKRNQARAIASALLSAVSEAQ